MKYRISAAALLLALLLSACGGEKFSLPIEVPPGSQGFAYSYEEVSSPSGRIELACGRAWGIQGWPCCPWTIPARRSLPILPRACPPS